MEQLNVMVVEDEPTMRQLLRDMLYRVGASRVVECEDATTGLAAFGREPFHIVMLDLGLPDRDGHELMQDIKSANPRQHVVLVTADDSIESIQKAISAGANGYVVKPYSQEKIQDVVNNYMMVHGVDDGIVRNMQHNP
ncbi:MAG: response regulator [Gammaproteobacteria bacterium]|nr:response regulator [Gammaproteobacteria bacterium]